MEQITYRTVFEWTCPECGTDHIMRPIPAPDMPTEEEREFKERLGIEPWEEGQLCMAPYTVSCPDCKREYAVFEDGPEEDDEK